MVTVVPAFVLLILFCAACFAAGYSFARRAGLRRERELSKELQDASARYRAAMLKRPDAGESEAEQWRGAYETMLQSYDSMKGAYESMKQAADSYAEASDANRRAYEDMKVAYETLLDSVNENKNLARG